MNPSEGGFMFQTTNPNHKMKSALSCLLMLGLTMACSSTRNQTKVVKETTTTETHQDATAVKPEDRNIVSSLEFAPGQRSLSPEATAELNRAILEAKQRGEVQEVNIAVWSDLASADPHINLPRSQVNIAKERGENIEQYVDRMEPDVNVKVHNMAAKPATFADYINSQDAATKQKMAEAGVAANSDTNEVKGPSSSAIVVIKVK
jgi:hypothetical protein